MKYDIKKISKRKPKNKFQASVTNFFRQLSFVLICTTLALFVVNVWLKIVPVALLIKLFMTTGAVIVSAVLLGVIFYDANEPEEKNDTEAN